MVSGSAPADAPPSTVSTHLTNPGVDEGGLLDALPSAAALFGPDRLLRVANRAARELLKLDHRTTDRPQTIEFVLAPVLDVARPLLRAVAAGLHGHVATARLNGPGGEQLVEVRLAPAGDGLLLFTATDVTSRELLLASLERRARELAAMFEVAPSSVRVVDAAGTIVRANGSAMREHQGTRPATLRELWMLDAPQDPDESLPLPYERHPGVLALAGELVRARVLTVTRSPEGERRVMELNAAPVTDADRRILGAVLVDRDVTREHRLARELEGQVRRSSVLHERVSTESERLDRMVEERSRELLALQETRARERRLAAVGQLAAGVMHDVNNALNPIMAAAYLLRHHAENPDAVRDYADRISKAADTGAATASRVGRFIRQEPMDATADLPVDLSVMTEEVLALTQPSNREPRGDGVRINVVRSYAVGANIRGIAGEIREALLNLVQNAFDAMPRGGTLSARTGVDGEEAWVSITDTGEGMTADVRERAFEPFFTTKGAHGSGLGLAEVYGIARRHRGNAEIVSAPGQGSTITMRFPLELTTPGVVAPSARTTVKSFRVLVVEDHDDGREFLRQLLLAEGHRVEAVATCGEALASLAHADARPFEVLITDVGLPDGSGWDLAAQARAQWPTLRVGVVTGWEPTIRGAGAGAADFILRKPLRAAELLAHVSGDALPAKAE